MQYKKIKASMLFFLGMGLTVMYAQETMTTTGGIASGSGGSVNYSIGLVVYTTATGPNGSVSSGGQQPYEISIVTEIEDAKTINLIYSAYPNPTSDFLTLKMENNDKEKLSCQLFDINGKLLESKKTEGNETTISLVNLTSSTYFLKVTENNKEVKTFKIIKK